jgi:hypothetical protein
LHAIGSTWRNHVLAHAHTVLTKSYA